MSDNLERDFIDFCKGAAILMVILVHGAQPFKLPMPYAGFFAVMQLGCQIFFVLSGYTLCRSLDTKNLTFIPFMKRRIGKIIPSWWGIILCYLAVGVLSKMVLGRNLTGSDLKPLDVCLNLLLLNGVIPGEANNHVVRGGWFVGTIVILYLLTPAIFRLYFKLNETFRKFLPLLLLAGDILILELASSITGNPVCENNSFVYFSFVNQLPVYVLGFVLYDLVKNKCPFSRPAVGIAAAAALVFSLALFFTEYGVSFILVPFLFGAGFAGLYLCFFDACFPVRNFVFRLIETYGKHSFGIYLTHSFIVYDCIWLLKKVLDHFAVSYSRQLLFPFLLPLLLAACFVLAFGFEKVIGKISAIRDSLFRRGENAGDLHQ